MASGPFPRTPSPPYTAASAVAAVPWMSSLKTRKWLRYRFSSTSACFVCVNGRGTKVDVRGTNVD
eukprot:7591150-Pyramimonas_sp.AAC.2